MAENEKSSPDERRRSEVLGTLLLVFGGAICLLVAADKLNGLPFEMPRSWYQNRPLWIGMAVAGLVSGILLQRPPRGDEQDTT